MSNLPLITAVIPTYKRPTLLRRAIRSALQQTFPSLKVCVYDNGSGDETGSVVMEMAKADPRVEYYCHSHNIGAYPNFQYGIDHVTTPFFSMLGDDDVLLPDFYRVAMAGFERYPEAFCSMCGVIHVDGHGKVWLVQGMDWKPGLYPAPQGMAALLRGQSVPPWSGFLYRREIRAVTGALDESAGNAADWDMQLRLAALRSMVVSTQPGVLVVSHTAAESTLSRQKLTWARVRGSARLRNKIMENPEIPEAARRHAVGVLNSERYGSFFRTFWLKAVLNGQWGLANRSIVVYRAVRKPLKARALVCIQWVMRNIPLARRTVGLAFRTYVTLRDIKRRQVQKPYANYGRYLENVDLSRLRPGTSRQSGRKMFDLVHRWDPDDHLLDRFVPTDHSKQASADTYVLQFLRAEPGWRVLDLGCGAGNSVDLFRKKIPGVRWVGVDVSESAEVLSRKRSDADFCTFDGTRLPFPDEVFDLIYCRQVLHHVPHPWELLREVRRVLRRGGLFVGSTSQLEPYQSRSHWGFTIYGFSRLVEEAGLRLLEVRPGIDSLTLILRRGLGRGRFSHRWFDHDSPLNILLTLMGKIFGKDHHWTNRIKLLFCGIFCFCAARPDNGEVGR